MNDFLPLPRGVIFKPTDEQLIEHYLKNKIASEKMDFDFIDLDLNEIEPWDIPELCNIGFGDRQIGWYFFGRKDKFSVSRNHTYITTKAGYWRAEGTGCAIYSDDENDHNSLIGMKKPLAFFQGREPNGLLSQWFMFEYRLETNEDESGTLLQAQEESWVLYKMFKEPLLQKSLLLENQLRPLLKGLPAATVEESNQRIGQY
ncbi:unnamed protein product [Trifolium pratense]|uniref:Uncharacterized protein n=1 Tax=Trifolium pratense TaxID=57577 RepID=A0ACB0K1T3_TRIPR|nr:unnamed protein product [Trifolium pratense]